MTNLEHEDEMRKQPDVEGELLAALDRLKRKSVRGREARISYSAVAAEAGRSRTLIGHEGCPYPKVREAVSRAIEAQKHPTSSPSNKGAERRNPSPMRAEPVDAVALVSYLKEQVTRLLKQNKTAAIRIVTIDDENQQLRVEISRLKTELGRSRAAQKN